MGDSILFNDLDISNLLDRPYIAIKYQQPKLISLYEGIKDEIEKIKNSSLFTTSKHSIIDPESKDAQLFKESLFRNDQMIWITPQLCKDLSLNSLEKYIRFVTSQIKNIDKICPRFKEKLNLNNEYSIQLSHYAGNGSSYVRHKDVNSKASTSSSSSYNRKLTCIIYLNQSCSGGGLRIHLSDSATNNLDRAAYIDIEPLLGTIVLFRSDVIEHEVLPTFSDRYALTIWALSSATGSNLNQIDTLPFPYYSLKFNYPKSANYFYTPTNAIPLEINDSNSEWDRDSISKKIFVSIASYRDPECQHTIRDLFYTAKYPSRIFIGLVWQYDPLEDGLCFEYPMPECSEEGGHGHGHIRCINLHSDHAKGPCFARHLAQSLWKNEPYYLQIDSHMRFRPNWDVYLISELEACRTQIKQQQQQRQNNTISIKEDPQNSSEVDINSTIKPILTTYPLGYDLPSIIPEDTRPTILVPTKFDENGILRQSGKVITPPSSQIGGSEFIRSPLWAAGFSFSDSSVIREVPYDPDLPFLFFGEEILMAARLFTSGYLFFTPKETVLYHLWKRSYRKVFNDKIPENDSKNEYNNSLKLASIKKTNEILSGSSSNILSSCYGLGNQKSLQDFETFCGVNFKSKFISDEAKLAGLHPYYFVNTNYCEFQNETNNDSSSKENNKINALSIVNKYLSF